jgi:hypothetical protein
MLETEESAGTAEELEASATGGVTRRAVEESRETRTKTYELVYDNERWKLADEISAAEDEVAKYLFQYALEE